MLRESVDPKLAYRVIVYLRMSSDQQNKRSPEQQLAEIKRCLKALRLKWSIVKVYRDDAKSGRYLRKRRDYQKMLQDIKTGVVQVDLILVDTLERFGRVEELPTIRKELYEKHGVLVLTTDTNFADPNTPQGKALGMFEAMRATEHGRILGHNVLRGKRDAIQQGHWPGGPAPFGLKLKSIMKAVDDRQEVDYCILVHNLETNWIMKLLLNKAYETGWGQTKLARFLNEHPEVPEKFKPFQAPSVGYWLDNPIYSGELIWEQNYTGIVDDTRVIRPNRKEDIIRVPGFCEPTVPREVQEAIWAVRRARSEHALRARAAAANGGKLIAAPAPGMTLKYLLSGLVRCGHCGRAMNPVSSAAYITKAGEEKRYTAYSCPGAVAGACPNHTRIPEEWLREVVIGKVRERLFPVDGEEGHQPQWLAALFEDVRQILAARVDCHPDQRAAYQHELQQLLAQQAGWLQSLAKVDLAPALRSAIETQFEQAAARQHEIEAALGGLENHRQRVDEILDVQQVLARMEKLPEVLALNNPTLGNLELSLHIDRIDCYEDGRIVMRTCKLGALTGVVDMLATDSAQQEAPTNVNGDSAKRAKPRRRARLRVDGGNDVKAAANTAADPDRFAGLGDEWFWQDTFSIPEKTWPFQEMAITVAIERLAGKTHEELAESFGVTVPTIRKALRFAATVDDRFKDLPRKMARTRWHEDHALEVAAKKDDGLGTDALAACFGVSDTTIRKALAHAGCMSMAPTAPASTAAGADSASLADPAGEGADSVEVLSPEDQPNGHQEEPPA